MSELRIHHDPIAETLDDMAALAVYWQRNRERGRMPNSIRAAMLSAAAELMALQDMERQQSAAFWRESFCRTAHTAQQEPKP